MAERLTLQCGYYILVAKKISACALHVRIGMRGLTMGVRVVYGGNGVSFSVLVYVCQCV